MEEGFENFDGKELKKCSSQTNSFYWLSFDGLKTIISMNPYDHLESEKSRIGEKRHYLIDNNQCLCEYGGLHPMIAIKGNISRQCIQSYERNIKKVI